MANKEAGEIDISLGGTPYTLRPSYRAVLEFEDAAGISVFEALQAAGVRQSAPLKRMAMLYRAAMTSAMPKGFKPPAVEEVARLIMVDGVGVHLANYFQILANCMASEEDLKKAAKEPTQGND